MYNEENHNITLSAIVQRSSAGEKLRLVLDDGKFRYDMLNAKWHDIKRVEHIYYNQSGGNVHTLASSAAESI